MSNQDQQPNPNADDDDLTEYLMEITDLHRSPRTPEGYEPIVQSTTRGAVEMRYYPPADAAGAGKAIPTSAALFVGGVGGGFDSPIHGTLYPTLCTRLQASGIAALRVQFRHPTILEEAVLDVLAGVSFLEAEGIAAVALIGHSFGGAVVLQAAASSDTVRACITLATQSNGAEPAAELGPRCPLLIVHGLADRTLPPNCSRHVHQIARGPKDLLLKEGVGHGLDEWADELPDLLHTWLVTHLPPGQG